LRHLLHALALMLPMVVTAQQMPLRYYGQQDGLLNQAITVMTRDHGGYLWIGTQNGLFRYNGTDFRRYAQAEGLDEQLITALLVDHEDRLWVANDTGLYLKDGERMRQVRRDDGRKVDIWRGQTMALSPEGKRYVISGQKVYTLTLRDGQPRMQATFSAQQIAQHPGLGALSSVHADAGGELWLGCGEALCRDGPEGLTVWTAGQGVPADIWRAILRDHDGQLWARGDNHIIALAPGTPSFINRTPPGDLLRKANLQPVLAEDPQHRILSNVDDGVVRWDGARWEHYGPANGLRSAGGVHGIQFDHDGGMWMGSLGLGLINWLGYGNWENWTQAQGLPDDVVLSFVRDGAGVLYAGTRSGPARLPPGVQRFTPAAASQHKDQWSALARDGAGNVWGGTYSGLLARLDADGQAQAVAKDLPGVTQLAVDRQQRLWLSTWDGISVVDIGGRPRSVRPPEGLSQPGGTDTVNFGAQCQAPDGTIWFQSQYELLHLDGARWSRHTIGQAGDAVQLSAMSCAGDGTLWLSDTRSNLWRATLDAQVLRFQPVDNHLVAGTNIVALREDSRGWLWVGTDAGVAVWNRRQWRFFNQNDGLVWNDTNGRVFYEDTDGSMWIATSNGASHVRHPDLLFAPRQLSVRIETAGHDGRPLAVDQSWRLPWSNTPLELHLASLHYQNRDMLRFHYRLTGLESRWSESAVPQLRYAALPPGDYQFEYYATNGYNQSASPLQKHALTVLPPWWRTLPFYLLCAMLALIVLTLLYRLRVRRLLRRQLFTEQLVRERTRELELSREQLRQRALKDSLTGAWNRGAIMEIIEHALEQALAQQLPLLLVLLDLDHFKRVNDNYGHAAGDAVLREAVTRLGAAVRQTDAVGRYGGEEFLMLLPGLDQAGGHARVEELRHAIRCAPIRISDEQSITVTGSFGAIAFDPRRPLPAAELIDRADQALYRSKENGRDRIEYAPAA
jgi:diguanylate cyclase (GGDEF)-like protein